MATDTPRTEHLRHRFPPALAVLALLPAFLAGCSIFRHDTKPSVAVEAPPAPEPAPGATTPTTPNGGTVKKGGGTTPRPANPTPAPATKPEEKAPAPPDSSLAPPLVPEHRPTVSAVLTAEQQAALEAQYRTDVERTSMALEELNGRTLEPAEADQRASAERFLTEGRAAFEAGDLPRAASLVGKARVIAEELKSGAATK